ncbi:MAG: porin [Planctomycetaceae bacterium]|jgi:hypothetical protein|nr:porin [Planctomycetaceae bacterium]
MSIRRTFLFAIVAGLLSVCGTAGAIESACELFSPSPCDMVCGTKKKKSKIEFYGWILTGITANDSGSGNQYGDGTPYGYNSSLTPKGGNSYVLMLEQPSDWKVNQLWLGAKKDMSETFDWGFRADFNYGTDSRYARNWGDQSFDYDWYKGDYYAAFCQLYGMVGTKKLNVKVGKFAGSFAYEGLAATKEFFYSHANICYGRPLTTTGVVVDSAINDKWSVSAGWTAGVFNSFDNPYGDSALLCKVTYDINKSAALTYKIFHNDKGARTGNTGGTDTYNTLIFTYHINKKWFYMIEGAIVDSSTYNTSGKVGGDAWGINQHLIYTVNDKLSVGLRGEFHHSHNSMFDMASVTEGGQGGDLIELTLAANYKLTQKITFRPEIRYDHADYNSDYHPFGGDESKDDQVSGGVSFILAF